jgi:Type IX secretion system protein PorV
MLRRKITLAILLIVVITVAANQGFAGDNRSGFNFLKIGQGARALALSETFVALADDANATYWNPAGLVRIPRNQLALNHNIWYEDIKISNFAYSQLLSSKTALGLNLTYVDTGDQDRTIENPDGNFGGFDGTFSPSDLAFAVSYASKITRAISAGFNLKYAHQEIDTLSSDALAIDAGLLYVSLLKDWSIGANLQNIGAEKGDLFGDRDPLPLNLKVGAYYRALFDKPLKLEHDYMRLGAEVNVPRDGNASYSVGVEYVWSDMFALRGGYQIADELDGFSIGAGLELGVMKLDYAFVPRQDLGDTSQISLLVNF